MQSPIVWIRSTDALVSEVARIGAGPLALDSESDSLHRYPEKVCLIQLTFADRNLLVDPLAGVDLEPLAPVLRDPQVTTILHGADYDLRALNRDFGLTFRGLFDTMVAARLIGERAFGLAALLDRFLGVKLDKKFQKADWSLRPLSPEMEAYAMLDTRHLEQLAGLIRSRLQELGREAWAAEEFERLEQIRHLEDPERKAEAFRRVKHSGTLAPRELGVLRALYAFRDSEAVRKGRPPFRIVRDDILLELSRDPVADPERVRAIRGMPRPFLSGRGLSGLLAAIREGLALPEDALPPRLEVRRFKKLPADLERRVKALGKRRDQVAERLGLESSVVATRSVLEQAQACLDAGDSLEGIDNLRRWQRELLFPEGRPEGQPVSSSGAPPGNPDRL